MRRCLEFVAVVAELFRNCAMTQMRCARGAVIILPPHFIQESIARKHFARVRVKELQQIQLAGGEFLDGFAAF